MSLCICDIGGGHRGGFSLSLLHSSIVQVRKFVYKFKLYCVQILSKKFITKPVTRYQHPRTGCNSRVGSYRIVYDTQLGKLQYFWNKRTPDNRAATKYSQTQPSLATMYILVPRGSKDLFWKERAVI